MKSAKPTPWAVAHEALVGFSEHQDIPYDMVMELLAHVIEVDRKA